MRQGIIIFFIMLLCLSLTGCAAIVGAAIGGALVAGTGGMVSSRTEGSLPISDNPYPVEYQKGEEWMKSRLMCPNGKNVVLKEEDKGKESITCPYHKEEINIEEARKRYHYYYYARKKSKPLPKQYLTEKDKKKYLESE